MSSIDERVVEMKFDTSLFQRGVQVTLDGLAKLKQGLQMKGSTKALDDVEQKASRMSFKGIETGLNGLMDKFKSMSVIGITALTNITNKAIDAGLNLGKSFAIAPITDGFTEYETKLGSIQTILANTAKEGTKLKDVNAALNQLNTYSDKTIYSFSDMTKNIGLFTNAGIHLKDATAMIQGFSNEAAASGTSSQGAASAAYQLSQALSAGKITLMDWRSLQNVGMGNKNMQGGILEIAKAMGTLKKHGTEAKDVQEDFNGSLKKGWLTSGVMSKYLTIMATDFGSMNAKQLEAQKTQLKQLGLNDKTINGLIAQQKMSQNAATKVRTLTALMGTLKEATGSGWASTFEILFGNFDEATGLFTDVNNTLGKLISTSANARNKVLGDWKALGGRAALIDTISVAFHALMDAIKPIKDAFRQIFPPITGKQLYALTESLFEFAQKLKMGADTAAKVKQIFAGVFALFSIGISIVKGIGSVLGRVFSSLSEGTGGTLSFLAAIGNWIVGVDKAIKTGKGFGDFFQKLGDLILVPIEALKQIPALIKGLFNGGPDSKAVTSAFDRIGQRAKPIEQMFSKIGDGWAALKSKFTGSGAMFAPMVQNIKNMMGELKDAITNSFSTGDFSGVLDTINTGLFGGLVLIFKKFMSNGINVDLGGGFLGKIGEAMDGLTGHLKAMQQNVKADTIQKIAVSVGILAASIVVLSLIDSAKLAQATGAIVGLFTGLVASMKLLDQVSSIKGAIKMPALAAGMMGLAVAILILSAAVKNLAGLDWQGLAKGLIGVMALMGGIAGMMQLMPKDNKNMISAGLGMIAIAIAIKILASAVKDFSGMDWGAMGKGLVGVSASLLALGLFAKFSDVNKMGISNGVGLILLATSLKIMYSAVKDFSGMDWPTLGKGLAGMAGALLIVGGAMQLMPANMLVSAAGLVVVSAALVILSGVLQTLGGMTWDEIAHGLVTLAGALGIIAGAMYLMTGALPGAAALLIVAASLAILVPILQTLGSMDIPTIAIALGVLAGVFAVLGLAGLALAPVVLPLMGLGAAIMLLGAGTALAGVGLMAFSAGLTMLSVAGAAGALALTAIATAIIGLIPMAMAALANGIVSFAAVIGNSVPVFITAMVKLIMGLLTAINTVAPRVIDTLLNLIMMLLNKLAVAVPKFVSAGMKIIIGFLNGINANIGQLVTAGTNLIVNLLNGISNNLSRVITAGVNLIKKFLAGVAQAVPDVISAGMKMITDILHGTATAIRSNTGAMNAAGADVASAIIDGMINGLTSLGGVLVSKAKGLAQSALNGFKSIFDIHSPSREMYKIGQYVVQGFVNGLDGNKDSINKAFDSMKSQLTDLRLHAHNEVAKQQKALDKLYKAKKRDKKAIADTKRAIAAAKSEEVRSNNALQNLTKNWTDDKVKLGKLADQYDVFTTRIKAANDKLTEAKKLRDDYYGSIKTQYNSMPDITTGTDNPTTVQDFANGLRKKINDARDVSAAMGQLRKLGLNDTVYKDLLAKGADALPFMKELLGTGKSGVNQINDLTKQLDGATAGLAYNTSHALYQAGVDSAAGIVKGLQSQQAAIEKQMDSIANAMVKSIKKSLGIKSPSREMMVVGKYSSQGVAKGLENYGHLVETASTNVGLDAIHAMRKTITGLDDIVGGNVDMRPVVRPVLDLTDIKNKAGHMDAMLAGSKVSADATYGQAKGASVGYSDNQQRTYAVQSDPAPAGPQITFTQVNNSPKAIGAAEVYRNTNNQLSRMKGALGK